MKSNTITVTNDILEDLKELLFISDFASDKSLLKKDIKNVKKAIKKIEKEGVESVLTRDS